MLSFTIRTLCSLAFAALFGIVDGGEAIAYRLTDWKEMHFDDPDKAAQHLAAVQKLGCEARQESHGGHTDVVYRSTQWQALELADDALAHQWEAWLIGAGFESLHGHAESHNGHDHGAVGLIEHDHDGHSHEGHDHGPLGAEEVAYRLTEWRTTHVDNMEQLPQFLALMKGLGCEVHTQQHDGHTDVSVRCPEWKHVEVATHEIASGWEGWLRKSGFEVRHDH